MARVKSKPPVVDKDKSKTLSTKGSILTGAAGGVSYSLSRSLTDFIGGGDDGQIAIDAGIRNYDRKIDSELAQANNEYLYQSRRLNQFGDDVIVNDIIREAKRVRNFVDLSGKAPPHSSLSPAAYNDVLAGNLNKNADVQSFYEARTAEAQAAQKKAESRSKRRNVIKTVLTLAFL